MPMIPGKTWAITVVLAILPRLAAAQVPPQVPVSDPYAPGAAPPPGPSAAPYTGPPPATPYAAPAYAPGGFSTPPPPNYVQQPAPERPRPHHHGFTIGAAMGP